MSNSSGQRYVLGKPIYVDHMCNDEFSFFFRCRTSDSQILVIKDLVIGTFYQDRILINVLRHLYERKIRQAVRQIGCLKPNSTVVAMGLSQEVFSLCSVVTEFHQGGNLFNWLADQSHLTLWTVCQVIQNICSGLSYLHHNRIFHGNLRFRDILFKSIEPNSVAIVLDVSFRALMDTVCSPHVYDLDRCPPELLETVLKIAKHWPLTNGRSHRNYTEIMIIYKLLRPTRERDMWCLGVISHQLLTGTAPYAHIQPTERTAHWQLSHMARLTHPMLNSFSCGVRDQLEHFLHPDPLSRALAEDGAHDKWFDDDQTREDNRNLLNILEYNFMQMEFFVYRDAMKALNRLRIR